MGWPNRSFRLGYELNLNRRFRKSRDYWISEPLVGSPSVLCVLWRTRVAGNRRGSDVPHVAHLLRLARGAGWFLRQMVLRWLLPSNERTFVQLRIRRNGLVYFILGNSRPILRDPVNHCVTVQGVSLLVPAWEYRLTVWFTVFIVLRFIFQPIRLWICTGLWGIRGCNICAKCMWGENNNGRPVKKNVLRE